MKQAEFNELVMDQLIRRVKQLIKNGEKSDKHTKVVEEPGKRFYYLRWRGVANNNLWYKYGVDGEKTIQQLVGVSALAFLEEPKYNGQGPGDSYRDQRGLLRVVNFDLLEGNEYLSLFDYCPGHVAMNVGISFL